MAEEMVDTTEGTESEAGSAPELDTSGFDDRLNQLTETMQSMQSGVEELRSRVPEPEAEPEPDPYEDWDDGGLFGGEVEQADRDRYQGALQDFVARTVQEAQAPMHREMERMRAHTVAANLKETFPEFRDNDKAREAFELVQEAAFNITGNEEQARRMTLNEDFFGLVYKASQAEQQAAEQVPASEHVDQLEPGGGTSPGGTGEEESIVDRVFANRQAKLPAWLK